MSTRRVSRLGLAVVLLAASPALAHHGYSAYDMKSVQSRKGTVTVYRMINPHAQLMFDVTDAAGNVEHWVVEAGTLRGMKESGATRDTFKPGDLVTVFFNPSVNGSPVGVLDRVEFADGRVYPVGRRSRRSAPSQ